MRRATGGTRGLANGRAFSASKPGQVRLAPRIGCPQLSRAPGLKQEPDAPLRLVDPNLQQTGGGDVVLFAAKIVNFTHAGEQRLIVFAQLGEHIQRIDKLRVVIADALQAGNMPDGSNRRAADLAYALRDVVGHCKDLAGVFIQQQVVVAKMRSAGVPMKVLGL